MRPSTSSLDLSKPHNAALLFVLGGLAAYLLPWLNAPGTALSMGGYDLAEWTSLYPELRFAQPPLLVTLALRLPSALLIILLAMHHSDEYITPFRLRWILMLLAVLITSIALLPPLEFISNTDDPNYRQQFALAAATLALGTLSLFRLPVLHTAWARLNLALLGLGISGIALAEAQRLLIGLSMPVAIGPGGIGTGLAFALLAAFNARIISQKRNQKRDTVNVSQHPALTSQ